MSDASLRPAVTALLPLTDSSLWARVAALLPYHIGGIAFDDLTKMKTLSTIHNANKDSPKPFLDGEGNPYRVPAGKVFIVGNCAFYLSFEQASGYAGEANSSGGSIQRQVLALGIGTGAPAVRDVLGWFDENQWISAASQRYDQDLRAPCYLYGVEIAKTPTININFTTGEHTTEDYTEILTLWLPENCYSTRHITFHKKDGTDYKVPDGKQFIAGLVQYHYSWASGSGIIGESDEPCYPGSETYITKNVLSLPPNDTKPDFMEVLGVFSAGKYVTGATQAYDKYLKVPTFLYGVEVDA